MTLLYGPCDGGPYHGRPLAHHETPLQVAYERHRPGRSIPGMQASADPDVAFGGYLFDAGSRIWRWKAETLWRAK